MISWIRWSLFCNWSSQDFCHLFNMNLLMIGFRSVYGIFVLDMSARGAFFFQLCLSLLAKKVPLQSDDHKKRILLCKSSKENIRKQKKWKIKLWCNRMKVLSVNRGFYHVALFSGHVNVPNSHLFPSKTITLWIVMVTVESSFFWNQINTKTSILVAVWF